MTTLCSLRVTRHKARQNESRKNKRNDEIFLSNVLVRLSCGLTHCVTKRSCCYHPQRRLKSGHENGGRGPRVHGIKSRPQRPRSDAEEAVRSGAAPMVVEINRVLSAIWRFLLFLLSLPLHPIYEGLRPTATHLLSVCHLFSHGVVEVSTESDSYWHFSFPRGQLCAHSRHYMHRNDRHSWRDFRSRWLTAAR